MLRFEVVLNISVSDLVWCLKPLPKLGAVVVGPGGWVWVPSCSLQHEPAVAEEAEAATALDYDCFSAAAAAI